jgi:photosystem II stability/assembly factor-like uncharacterized protein
MKTNTLSQIYLDNKKIIITFFLLFFSITSFSQWQTIYYPTITNFPGIFTLSFFDSNIGMAAGSENTNRGLIIRTYDSGNTWDTTLIFNDTMNFNKIIIIDSVTVFAVGSNPFAGQNEGAIVRSLNFGQTWNTILFPKQMNSIDFPSHDIGYAVGSGSLYKTVNCGSNWAEINTGFTDVFYSTKFINDSVGFILGYAAIYKTIDGGNHWTMTDLGMSNYLGTGYLTFSSDSIGYCFCSDADSLRLFKTTNCGNTWHLHSIHASFNYSYSMAFPDDTIGYIVGFFNIEKTTDGGLTWSQQTSSPPSWGYFYDSVTDICCINDDTCFAVGPGQFYKTLNGGNSLFIAENINHLYNIKAYPNPFSEFTNIRVENLMCDNCSLFLFNSIGQIVFQVKKSSENDFKIYKKDLNNGVYFFQIMCNSELIGKGKLIIK